jgi:hypothetical protein
MTLALPNWAQTPEAIRLLAEAVVSDEGYRITPGDWIQGGGKHVYRSRAAAQLRALHHRQLEKLIEAENAAYLATPWDCEAETEAVRAYLRQERPDDLIERLSDDEGFLGLTAAKLADPLRRAA